MPSDENALLLLSPWRKWSFIRSDCSQTIQYNSLCRQTITMPASLIRGGRVLRSTPLRFRWSQHVARLSWKLFSFFECCGGEIRTMEYFVENLSHKTQKTINIKLLNRIQSIFCKKLSDQSVWNWKHTWPFLLLWLRNSRWSSVPWILQIGPQIVINKGYERDWEVACRAWDNNLTVYFRDNFFEVAYSFRLCEK